MAKRKIDECGYVQNLSPIKISKKNAKYFNFTLQCDTSEYRQGVCFDSSKMHLFQEVERLKSPVKIAACGEGQQRLNQSRPDVTVDWKSIVTNTNVEFPYQKKKEESATICDIRTIQSLPERSLVTTNASVLDVKESCDVSAFGELVKMQEIFVADEHEFIQVDLFGNLIDAVEVGSSYCFSNMRVKSFQGCVRLSSTKQGSVQKIDNIPKVRVKEGPMFKTETICGFVNQVNVRGSIVCSACQFKAKDIDLTKQFMRCPSCWMNQLITKCGKTFEATVHVVSEDSSDKIKVLIPDSQLRAFFHSSNHADKLESALLMEEFFLTSGPIAIRYHDQIVEELELKQ